MTFNLPRGQTGADRVLLLLIILTLLPFPLVTADVAVPPAVYSPDWITPGTFLQYEIITQNKPDLSHDYVVNQSLLNLSVDLITPSSVYYTSAVTPAGVVNATPVTGSYQWEYGKEADPCFYIDPADPLRSVLSPDGRKYSVLNASYKGRSPVSRELLIMRQTAPDSLNETYRVIYGKESGIVYEFSSESADQNHQKRIRLLS